MLKKSLALKNCEKCFFLAQFLHWRLFLALFCIQFGAFSAKKSGSTVYMQKISSNMAYYMQFFIIKYEKICKKMPKYAEICKPNTVKAH